MLAAQNYNRLLDFLKGIQLANVATVVFSGLVCFDLFYGLPINDFNQHILSALTHVVFLQSPQNLFQYWMIKRSGDYRDLVEKNFGFSKLLEKMMWATAILFVIILCLKMNSNDSFKVFLMLAAIFANWHTVSQTKGLYYIDRLSKATEKRFLPDLKMIKYLVFMLFVQSCFLRVNKEFHFYQPMQWLNVMYGFIAVSFLLILAIAISAFLNSEQRKVPGWILFRFLFFLFAVFSPVFAFAIQGVHGAETFDVMRKVRKQSLHLKRDIVFSAVFYSVIFFVVFTDSLTMFSMVDESRYRFVFDCLLSFSLAASLVHYMFDAFAYRMRAPEVQTQMLALLK